VSGHWTELFPVLAASSGVPDSEATKGDKSGEKPKVSAEAIAPQQMMQGIHFWSAAS
jgi:hypothetical protein